MKKEDTCEWKYGSGAKFPTTLKILKNQKNITYIEPKTTQEWVNDMQSPNYTDTHTVFNQILEVIVKL